MKKRTMTKACLLTFLTFITLLFFGACSEDDKEETGTIYGKVSDARTGEMIAGAEVTLTPGGRATSTGTNGIFEFSNLDAKQYELQAKKEGYQSNTKPITVVPGQNASGDIQLTPLDASAKLAISTSVLNFGASTTTLSFDIINQGKEKFNWNISGLDGIDWLQIAPLSGSIEGGKSFAVKATLLREKLKENAETILIINVDKESVSLRVTAEAKTVSSKIELSVQTLNFGKEHTSLTFDIKNIGTAGLANWEITGIDADWLTVSPKNGSTDMGKKSAVKVTIDRTKIKEDVSTTILVKADGESLPLVVTAEAGPATQRSLGCSPAFLNLGYESEGNFVIVSLGGPTDFQLLLRGNAPWMSFSETSGTIPAYVENNPTACKSIDVHIDRTGLAEGDYACTILIRSDLGDYELPVSMSVKAGEDPKEEDYSKATVISCDARLSVRIVNCRRNGSSVVFNYTITNDGMGEDIKDFRIYGISNTTSTGIADNQGNSYTERNAAFHFAGKKPDPTYHAMSFLFPQDKTLSGSITLTAVDAAVTQITSIKLQCLAYPDSYYQMSNKYIEFAGVPIF